MINDNQSFKTLSPVDPELPDNADFLVDLICCGDLNNWQLQAAIKKIASFDPKTRTDVWIRLREDLPPELYNALHSHYVRYCLNHRWGK